MIVTRIEPLAKTRYKVYINGEFCFVLYKGELSRFGIRVDEEVEEQTVEKILSEVVLKRAKLRCLRLLEDMDRTETALRDKLKQGYYPQDIIDQAVAYVKSFGYLDDVRYAENFVRSRQGTKSRREIEAALRQKGVRGDLIDRALEECYQESGEEEAILRIIKKKKFRFQDADDAEKQKMYAYLARKGFRYDAVRQVIQNCDDDA